ncbi:hypothetical protein GF359_05115 [candidate division WOR-3 bacterium]|uniref:Uncharacterized protein n=1 Tax=candidate division WOR-3 bacterium TaxID=2052148 RepID=A0A9D5K903_UNCW3|nr:hypothetical protein [candidate division WOR-3 bacterium]MBD3364576.1 hypothetical protein [candidate division WOR-3 bacterium]
MFGLVVLIFLVSVLSVISVSRFVFSLRKLAAGSHDTRNHKSPNRQDKPPLVFWAVASPILAAAFVFLAVLIL